MHDSDSRIVHGTNGSPQNSIEMMDLEQTVSEIEASVEEDYLRNELPKGAPITIPTDAIMKEEDKNGYKQVKYTWKRGDYKYTARWHTRTMDSPSDQGDSWVIERHKVGKGFGPDARPAERSILVKGTDGKGHWVSKSIWQDAIRAKRLGIATKEQKELLDNGHWKDNK